MNETIPTVSDSHPRCAILNPTLWSREVVVNQAEGAVVKVQRGGVAIAGHKGNAKVDTHGVAVSGVGGYSGVPATRQGGLGSIRSGNALVETRKVACWLMKMRTGAW